MAHEDRVSSPEPVAPHRPALQPKWIALILALGLVYLLLRPFLVERFGWNLPGFTDVAPPATDESQPKVSEANVSRSSTKPKSARNQPIEVPTIPEQSEPVIAESANDSSGDKPRGSSETPESPRKPTDKSTTDPESEEETPPVSGPPPTDRIADRTRAQLPSGGRNPGEPKPKTAPPPATDPGKVAAVNKTSNPPVKTNGKPASPPSELPKLGVLTPIGDKAFRSTAGLIYRQERSEHRIDHVMQHSRDNASKPVHGVYTGTREEILSWIDEAYMIAQKRGPPQVIKEDQGDRITITVNLNRKIGYMGGENGARRGHPPLKMIKLVLEDQDVITAYPTNN